MLAPFAPHYGDEVGRVCQPRNGVEQSRADPTKDRAIGADAEGEGQYRQGREAGRLCEHSKGVTGVVNQVWPLALKTQLVALAC